MTKMKELFPTDELRRLFYVDDAGVLRNRVHRGRVQAGAVSGTENYRHGGSTYMSVWVHGIPYYAHRIAYALYHGACPPHLQIDHKNGDGLDNRAGNLHLVTQSKNQRNALRRTDNTLGHTGVTWHEAGNCWRVRIFHNGKRHHIGLYNTIEEAVAARKKADRDYGYTERHGSERGVNS